MNTQELIEALNQTPITEDNGLYVYGLMERAAQALTASQERERVLREALEEIVNPADPWDRTTSYLRETARQALQSTEQQ